MKTDTKASPAASPAPAMSACGKHPVLWMALLLAVVLGVFFWKSFTPGQVVFANDDPLGIMASEQMQMPAILNGVWQNMNWLGNETLSPSPDVTSLLMFCFSPRMFLNLFYPLSLFIVGMGACYCLRQFKLAPAACLLGGLAAAMNGDFLSIACWGLASQVIAFGASFFAIGLLANASGPKRWVKIVLAGMAVGLNVMEAYDVGAIFSVFVAAFALYQSVFLSENGPTGRRVGRGIARLVVVTIAALFIAFHTVNILVTTQIQGIAGVQQDEETKRARWNEATQWSVPKTEALGLFVPGLFGYRMDSTGGANYWGAIGRDTNIGQAMADLSNPDEAARGRAQAYLSNGGLLWRFSGTGFYAGIPVVIIALWAACQSLRKHGSVFSLMQRKSIWFWSAIVVVTLLLSFGRYAPFYRFFYALPYVSTIRNPLKFMNVLSLALVILFGYGVHGLIQAYMQNQLNRVPGAFAQFKAWLARASAFEKKWVVISFAAIPVALLVWLIYGSFNKGLLESLKSMGVDPGIAPATAAYTLHAMGWFVFFLAITVGLMALIFSGHFSGARAKWGIIFIGIILFLDLGGSDQNWILYWDVAYKYASNPIIKMLADKPYEHRVTKLPFASPQNEQMKYQIDLFAQLYGIEWHQQVFPYNNIQSLEMVQEPRVTVDKNQFLAALPYPPVPGATPASMLRTWELMNTRYLIGQGGGFVEALNQQLDHGQNRFRIVESFRLELKPGSSPTNATLTDFTAVPSHDGELALIEFTGALPRAKLFSNWQVSTNAESTLTLLASASFDPHLTVLVSEAGFPNPVPANALKDPGTVDIDPNYKSKHIELNADVKVPSVLLISERYNAKWRVEVDGKPTPLLRCDYIMRGVALEPGKHHVVMSYVAPMGNFFVSVAAVALGLALCGYLAVTKDEEANVTSPMS